MDNDPLRSKKIKTELLKVYPGSLERGELCQRTNIPPLELAYLLRAYPERFKDILVEKTENNQVRLSITTPIFDEEFLIQNETENEIQNETELR